MKNILILLLCALALAIFIAMPAPAATIDDAGPPQIQTAASVDIQTESSATFAPAEPACVTVTTIESKIYFLIT